MGDRNFLQRIIQGWKYNTNLRLSMIAVILIVCASLVWVAIYIAIKQQSNSSQATDSVVRNIDVDVDPIEIAAISDIEVERSIDGILVPEGMATPYPVAVMIENAAFDNVRPQFGLSKAHVVYELVVEGGITRFLAVFAADIPDKIGPIRSARPTFLEFVSEYDGLYSHAGGSPEALQSIDGLAIKDMSALGADSRFFYRDTGRAAPHNLFTTGELISYALRDKSLEGIDAGFEMWTFKDEAEDIIAREETHFVDIDFGSGPLYIVHYEYHADTNSYQRSNGGELQHDANNDEILSTKNIIVQVVPPPASAGDEGRINFDVTGSGKAYVARDGEVIEGTWEKNDRLSRTKFYNEDGTTIELNRGNTWVTLIPDTGTVNYN